MDRIHQGDLGGEKREIQAQRHVSVDDYNILEQLWGVCVCWIGINEVEAGRDEKDHIILQYKKNFMEKLMEAI